MTCWVTCLGLDASTVGTTLAGALVRVGVDIVPPNVAAPGVLVFSEQANEVPETIESLARPARPLLAVSYEHEVPDPWQLLQRGAADVLPWIGPPDPCAESIAARLQRSTEVDAMLASAEVTEVLVGTSKIWTDTVRRVVEVSRFTRAPVLLVGESGTGKELLARLIHRLHCGSQRGPLVTVDCTTVVPTLSGSELFGHARGAFTGATNDRQGAFARADGGTLFLDEIGELPVALQAELLRVLQEGTFKPVGSDTWRSTTFRLVSATHRDLRELGERGMFRFDLFYRIAAFVIDVPPLRDRVEDIDLLARHFLESMLGSPLDVPSAVERMLRTRSYPGNVRDLRHLMARIAAHHVGSGPISVGDVPAEDWPTSAADRPLTGELEQAVHRLVARGASLRELRERVSELAVDAALEQSGGNVRAAASHLGVTDRAIQLRRAARRETSVNSPGITPP